MHEISRNLLYEVKKEANKRADPFFVSNSQDDDIRAENQRLRTKLRSLETQIIRLNSKVEQLNQKILINTAKYRTQNVQKEGSIKEAVNQFSSVPMALQFKQLKENNEILHQQNLALNGKNNKLQAQMRQLKSDKYGLQLRIKQFNILEKMREQRFKDEVDRLTPIIIQQPAEYTAVKEVIKYLTGFLRARIVEIMDHLFMQSAKQCQFNKKLNSFTVFSNYWREIKAKQTYGLSAVVNSYLSVRKVMKMIDEKFGEIDQSQGDLKDTLDQWVINSVIQIQASLHNEQQRRLFRFLGLKYRCKFPIKGQKFEMSQSVKGYLEHAICLETSKILTQNKIQASSKGNSKMNSSSSSSILKKE